MDNHTFNKGIKMKKVLLLMAIVSITLISCCDNPSAPTPTSYDLTKLSAVKVTSAPDIDGVVDALWTDAPTLEVLLL